MRITILAIQAFIVLSVPAIAQTNQFLTRADSDPLALNLLDKMATELSKDRLSLKFNVSVNHPGEKPVSYSGTMTQQGSMYRIVTESMEIWCNGKLRWVYSKDAQEVQLYSEEEDDTPGPLGLIKEYTGDQYIATLSGAEQIGSQQVQVLELKPVDRNSEVAKVRLSIQRDGKPVRMEVFEKTSARTVSDISDITVPQMQPASYFSFNKANYPGVHLEDLRID